jgi:wyosine [tRNA(Phe)-imidazoG37] synthetase (radical SAM superfamily)
MVLSLQEGILYGPVKSRRLGKSLGINLMPASYKLCSFNCLYCHYGWTKIHTMDLKPWIKDLPSLDLVIEAVEGALRSKSEFDFITFSGNGEPTLYPWFAELVDQMLLLRNRYRPGVKIALLSNSTGLVHADVKESLSKIDLPFFKLDAGTEEKFKEINRPPAGVKWNAILNGLSSLRNIYIQTLLIDGNPSNVTEEDLAAYFRHIRTLQPIEVHLYSTDRPVPDHGISRVSRERLEAIALRGQAETGVKMRVFSLE